MNKAEQNIEDATVNNDVPRNKKLRLSVAAITVAGTAMLAAAGVNFILLPAMNTTNAESKLQSIQGTIGEVEAAKTTMTPYQGEKIKNVNTKQMALNEGAPKIRFINSKKTQLTAKNIEVYLDFSSQASRDFLSLNQNVLANKISRGEATLTVLPIPTPNTLNMYSFEALAEAVATNPKNSWQVLTGELKNATANASIQDKNSVASSVATAAQSNGATQVNAASIKNGTFASWIASGAEDSRIKTGFTPPLIYVNNEKLDSKTQNLNDTTTFIKAMEGRS